MARYCPRTSAGRRPGVAMDDARARTGLTVQAGDPGIANAYGDTTYDLNHFAGTGTAVYAPDLVFEPAAVGRRSSSHPARRSASRSPR